MNNNSLRHLTVHLLSLLWLRGVIAENVTVELLSPRPACPNQYLVYNCHVEFPSVTITWTHPAFGRLTFTAGDVEVGSMMSSNDGRVVANLTMNEGTMVHRMVASTLTIQPPLNDLNGTNLNGTNLTCETFESTLGIIDGVDTILLAGVDGPSPLVNLEKATPSNTSSTTIEWDPPVFAGGNGVAIQVYRVEIPKINYSMEENGTARSHTIVEGSAGVMFNTLYLVEVTAINACEDESDSRYVNITIEANAPPQLSLSANLLCTVESERNVDLQWKYETPMSSVYTPPTESVTVEIDGPAPVSANECADLNPSDTTCNFNITEDGNYTVTLNSTNEIGTTSEAMDFDFNPLGVDYSHLADTHPHVLVSLNNLCQNDTYTVIVIFGTRPKGTMGRCEFQQPNVTIQMVTKPFVDEKVWVPEDITWKDGEEYCWHAVLRNDQGIIDEDGDASKDVIFSKEAISATAVFVALGVGAVICISAASIYWLLPHMTGVHASLIVLMAVGVITSTALPLFGIVLIATCCCCRGNKCGDECCNCSCHNDRITTILLYIGVVTCIILFPLGIAALIVWRCLNKERAQCVVISFGIVGCAIVFPIGFTLSLYFYCCHGKGSADDQPYKKFQHLSKCHKSLIMIGTVTSAVILPLGFIILICYLCERQNKKDAKKKEKEDKKGEEPKTEEEQAQLHSIPDKSQKQQKNEGPTCAGTGPPSSTNNLPVSQNAAILDPKQGEHAV